MKSFAVLLAFALAGLSASCSSKGSTTWPPLPDASPHDAAGSHPHDAASDSASKDARTGHDAGDATEPADASTSPIVAPNDTWTWVDFPESKCASGTATGIAVNPHAGATELVIYFEGGGQCTDATSCWGAMPTANNVAGYDQATFLAAKQVNYPPLVRSFANNPFGAMNLVYIPYCTGDMHFGTVMSTLMVNGAAKPTYFWGAKDMDLFLARIVPTFPGASRVYSYGTSAGGFSSFLNFDRLVRAFGVRVDIIDDSGPPLTAPGQTNNAHLFTTWAMIPPAGCTACNSLLDIMKFDRQEQPGSKVGFLSLSEDTTISVDFGYSLAAYGPALETLFGASFGSDPNVATYLVGSDPGHVVESQPALAPDYMPWLTALVIGSATWASGGIDGG